MEEEDSPPHPEPVAEQNLWQARGAWIHDARRRSLACNHLLERQGPFLSQEAAEQKTWQQYGGRGRGRDRKLSELGWVKRRLEMWRRKMEGKNKGIFGAKYIKIRLQMVPIMCVPLEIRKNPCRGARWSRGEIINLGFAWIYTRGLTERSPPSLPVYYTRRAEAPS